MGVQHWGQTWQAWVHPGRTSGTGEKPPEQVQEFIWTLFRCTLGMYTIPQVNWITWTFSYLLPPFLSPSFHFSLMIAQRRLLIQNIVHQMLHWFYWQADQVWLCIWLSFIICLSVWLFVELNLKPDDVCVEQWLPHAGWPAEGRAEAAPVRECRSWIRRWLWWYCWFW